MRGPGSGRALGVPLLAAGLLLGGCTADGGPETSDKPIRSFAVTPSPLPPEPAASAGGSGRPSPGSSGGPGATAAPARGRNGSPAATGTAATPERTTPASGGSYRLIAEITDRTDDAEGELPAYADVVAVRIEDGGDSVRFTVEMAGDIPSKLYPEETMGVGVDLFRELLQTESDYQVYVDGQPEGWYAYLHTPRGFVRYPGTFALGGRRLVFTVPWSSVGGQRSGRFSGFSDWTRATPLVNAAGEDHAPDLGHQPWSR